MFDGHGQVLARAGLSFALELRAGLPDWALDAARATATWSMHDRATATTGCARWCGSTRFGDALPLCRPVRRRRRCSATSSATQARGRRSIEQLEGRALRPPDHLRADLHRSWRCCCCSRRSGSASSSRPSSRAPIGRLITAAERVRARRSRGARSRRAPNDDELGMLSRAFNRMTDQLESQRARADRRQPPARRAPPLHRDGAGRRVGRRDRPRRRGPHRAAEPLGLGAARRPTSTARSAGRSPRSCRRWRRCSTRRRAAPERLAAGAGRSSSAADGTRTLLVRIARRARRRRDRRLRRHLRRHHRPAVGAAQGGLGRRRAPHRARDQEPADPDPALGRAAEAQIPEADQATTPRPSRSAPTRSSARSATSAAWSTSSRPSRGCRRRCCKPEDLVELVRAGGVPAA